MSYPFHCPQGHILQGELSSLGQVSQCPVCGVRFFVPPPDCGATMSGSLQQESGAWPSTSAATLPVAAAVDPQPASPHPADVQQPFDLSLDAPPLAALPAANQVEPPSRGASAELEETPFDLGFDMETKAPLPLELPRQHIAVTGGAAEASKTPTAPAPTTAKSTALSIGGVDSLDSAPTAQERPSEMPPPPKLLHIRCPSGHVVKAPSELLGKLGRCAACKKTFEVRYENSIEFQRRTKRLLCREQGETGRTWAGWAFVAAFLVFAALVGAVFVLGQ